MNVSPVSRKQVDFVPSPLFTFQLKDIATVRFSNQWGRDSWCKADIYPAFGDLDVVFRAISYFGSKTSCRAGADQEEQIGDGKELLPIHKQAPVFDG
ncbi:hypothetical protein MYX65_11655, partial [Acidobacteria bacterium AH-259-L09]|nr:hypothetical protein [Acidobacteria bacterium AH-259-L09]